MAEPCEQAETFFVISAEDCDLACSVLQARFIPTHPTSLFALIPAAQVDDPHHSNRVYPLDDRTWRRVVSTFNVPFDASSLEGRNIEVSLWQATGHSAIPYLVHGGFELVLLLDGSKKLARMVGLYPPGRFAGEDAFDRHVEAGRLHKEEALDPWEKPDRDRLGHRTVYYTPPGEEWRIPAMKLLYEATSKSGGWNETYERLEGMLFGYADWQNDWWIENGRRLGLAWAGTSFCCTVDETGLTWLESAGHKALPPMDAGPLTLSLFQPERPRQPLDLLAKDPAAAAVLHFNMPGWILLDMVAWGEGGPWHIPPSEIPAMNRAIKGPIDVVLLKSQI